MARLRALAVVLLAAGCGGSSTVAPTLAPEPAPGESNPAPRLDPHAAGLAYARCMRGHGVDHPDPDANGDFHLTPAQERRMRASASPKERTAADRACFHLLKGTVSTKPLSRAARAAALVPLRELKSCLHGFGYDVGTPVVKPMSHGRARFGFDRAAPTPATAHARERLGRAQRTCERRVHLAARLDEIIATDRGENR